MARRSFLNPSRPRRRLELLCEGCRAGVYRGLFVYSGTTTIENLKIEHAVAQGGAGGVGYAGGGGGAGLGGGLFVANNSAGDAAPANVTLDNVVFAGAFALSGTVGLGGGGGGGLVSHLATGDNQAALVAASEACWRAPKLPAAHCAHGQAFAALGEGDPKKPDDRTADRALPSRQNGMSSSAIFLAPL
jgi:hypothetical protein